MSDSLGSRKSHRARDSYKAQDSPRFFHGWIVVAAVHAALFVIFGVAYSFAAFFSAFQAEFGASRGDVSLIFSICGFLYFFFGAFAGQLADRIGPRRLALTGMAILAGGLFYASRATSLPGLYIAYGVGIGLGVGLVYVPAVSAVQPWFARRRGLASGISAAGIGVGTLVVPLIAAWLIAALGWRRSFEMLAIGALVLGGSAAMLIDNNPARRGLSPDGVPVAAGAQPTRVVSGVSLRAAIGTRMFWLWYASITFCSIAMFMPFVHLVPYARDAGLSEATGVFLMGLIGVGSLVGRFGLAGLGDRLTRPALLAGSYGTMALMLVVWLVSSNVWALAIFATVFGAGYGMFVAACPPLAMDYFGARSVAGIIGCVYTGAGIGNLVGPTVAGFVFDATGSYSVPILIAIACMCLAAVCAILIRREPTLAQTS